MIAQDRPPARTQETIRDFIHAFFGEGNLVWPDQDPDSATGRRLLPFLQVLRGGSEIPVVLPRRRPGQEHQLTAYVIALDQAHATAVAELLTAFVGPSYSFFNGPPAQLDPHDPVDRAVLDFAGPSVTFTVSSPTRETQARTWTALEQMQAVIAQRPIRTWHTPRPIGKLLAEFEVALAAGDNSASAQLLDQLAASGGISATNLANLRIKRLSRLGLDAELLRMPGLTDTVLADPPMPVRDAVLAALYTCVAAEPLTAGQLPTARDRLINAGALVPALLTTDFAGLSAEALTVLTLASWIRGDTALLHQLANDPSVSTQVEQLAPELAAIALPKKPSSVPVPERGETFRSIKIKPPASWLELITATERDPRVAEAAVASQTWRKWAPPATDDEAIAAALARLNDAAADQVWSLVGPFVDADGYQQPAAASARELIDNALAHDRFGPGDLAGLAALTEIFLRSGPPAREYSALLDDLAAECDRWAGPDRANIVLDFVDLLARSAAPDREAQLRFDLALLRPLHDHAARLEPDQARLAAQLSAELDTGLEWPQPASLTDSVSLPALNVLLYSLDEGVLQRTHALLSVAAPGMTISLSHDLVGSPQLRQHARNADVVVMATRCATHAATSFIRANARKATIAEADGSGSASLLNAAVSALKKVRTQAEASLGLEPC